MKKVIVFDIDRTIVDSYSSELLSFQEAYFNVTGNKLSEDDINNFTTLPTSQFFDSLNLNNNTIDLINKEWSECFNSFNTVCFPNIKNIIRKLKKDGYIIGIITSRTLDEFHELDDELNEINAGILKTDQEREVLEEQLGEFKSSLEENDRLLSEAQIAYHKEKSRLDAMKNIAERYDGYGGSIKRVMEQKDKNKQDE